ncbi:MAG: hypothetical protein IT341_03315 [Chloroflexi bacterium]|nr:hypothetical protein [Chloroflexota bacterium]
MDDAPIGGPPAGATCPGCGEPIQVGQAVIRLTAGLLMAGARLDPLIMRPDVFIHAGAGYDTRYNVNDRWCVTSEAIDSALRLMLVSDTASASGH